MPNIKVTDELKDYALLTYNLHKDEKEMSMTKMAEMCKMSDSSFRDVIQANEFVVSRNFEEILDVVDEKRAHPQVDKIRWAALKHGWEYDDLISTARKARAERQKLESEKANTKGASINEMNASDIVNKLDTLISCIIALKTSVENATQTIPQNINATISEEFSAFTKKIDAGAISFKQKKGF